MDVDVASLLINPGTLTGILSPKSHIQTHELADIGIFAACITTAFYACTMALWVAVDLAAGMVWALI
eukprot:snap_masked-scaffold_26-processed-gene-2.36-mRNA-1 protein AED:1.00 eAED:1.00 QI:0/-1/0/0/-1/1/1/0/66